MKKFLSAVLVCALTLLSVVCFSACSKKKDYNLSNLKPTYETVADGCASATLSADKIVFNYGNYKKDGYAYLENVINTVEPYTRLNDFYNPLLQYSMSFAYSYLDLCSKQAIKVDEATKQIIDNDFKTFKQAVKNVDDHVGSLARIVQFEYDSSQEYNLNYCVEAYKALFNSYDWLITAALKYNFDLANIYFNNALTGAFDDYSKYSLETFDANKTMVNFKSQTDYQALNLTRAYFNTYVRGNVLTEYFLSKSGSNYNKPDANFRSFLAAISSITLDSTFDEQLPTKMAVINSNANLKLKFYEESVAMSNIQIIMNNDLAIYHTAINEVVYAEKRVDPNATDYEKFCVKMIENHNYIVNEYSKVLINIINIINNAGV